MATALTSLLTRFTDKCNRVLAGGIVKTYEPNSLTPKVSYQDPEGTIPNLPEVVLDETGRAKIYLLGDYRVQVYSNDGVLIEDNLLVEQALVQRDFNDLSTNIQQQVDEAKQTFENTGGFISAPTLEALQAITPEYDYQLARVDATGDEYRWNPALTTTVKWEATGRNFLSEAKLDATNKANAAKDIAISRCKGLYDIFKDASKINDRALSLTGNLVDLVGTKTTDYIPVMAGDVLGIRTRSQQGEPIIVAYNADKSFHSVLATKTTASNEYDINNITIVSGIAYLRLSYFSAAEANCYIKKSVDKVANSMINTKYISDVLFNHVNLHNSTTTTIGKFLLNNVLTNSANYSVTDYIEVDERASYVCNISQHETTSDIGVHFYDSSKNFIRTGLKLVKDVSFETPANCKFIRCNLYTQTPALVLIFKGDLTTDVAKEYFKEFLKTYDANDLFKIYTSTKGSYINTSGVLTTSANWAVTEFIPVAFNDRIQFTFETTTNNGTITGYDINHDYVKTFATGNSNTVATYTNEITINDPDVVFIRASFYHVNGVGALRKVPTSSGSSGTVTATSRYSGKRWLAFGTSIVETTNRPNNYPKWVSEKMGLILTNLAIGGTRVRSCFQKDPSLLDTRITNADLITIDHGTNDFKIETALGSITDTPTSATLLKDSAYRANSNTDGTFFGDLMGVIEYIYSVKPSARIYLVTPIKRTAPAANNTDTNSLGHKLIDYRNAIIAIAEKYSLPVLDNYLTSGFNGRTMSSWTEDGLHPTPWAQENILANKMIGFLESN